MDRLEARRRIADAAVRTTTEAQRASAVSDWWGLGPQDPEWAELPASVREELEVFDESPKDVRAPRYDVFVRLAHLNETKGVTNAWLESKLVALGEPAEVTGEPEPRVACPCCRYLSLEQAGYYEICRVCFWEDDGARKPDTWSGPNHMTLAEGRANFERLGACDENGLEHVDPEGRHKYPRS